MQHSQLIEKITQLGLHGFKEAYARQSEDVNYHSLAFEERLYQLLDAQSLYLRNKAIAMNRKLSKIKEKHALIEEIDFNPKRCLDKAFIHSLATLNFIRSHQNIIMTGKTGTGKSYLAQAFANRAIMDGFRVHYIRTPTLLEEIRISRIDGTYTNLLKKYSKFHLLILDDFGVSAMHEDDATNLFEIIEDRTQINSTIITSQLPVCDWYDYLNNNTIADAILDRIVHSSHRIEMEGDSMRKLHSTINKSITEK
ncbi:MAG: IS21-like element helper ATPase IstB [Sulfuricurvum sp.]|jgi:DNA replication protein DnaC|uniref:IS21-like element helper ATPase IstB n=1 Tax=Sulfuricurvum sp. TaxID=2025608 RepID=UPI0025DD0A16|nr:IS21-like element helper ATPase IstB [Sulfuricurvum sp.]MCK9373699.1 IS21-like element helper ATPase IstB [Sulfuricurvum sp.]